MVVQYVQDFDGQEVASSRSMPLNQCDPETLVKQSLELIKTNTKTFLRPGSEAALNNAIKFLGISVGKFKSASSAQNSLQTMFANQAAKKRRISVEEGVEKPTVEQTKPKQTEEGKMKSFFANYLQTRKEEQNGTNKVDEKPSEEGLPKEETKVDKLAELATSLKETEASKKSYFESFKRKLIDASVSREASDDKATPTSTPPELRESFFVKYLRQQKEVNKAAERSNETAAKLDSSSEMQDLAAELDEIESSNHKPQQTVETVPPEEQSINQHPHTEVEALPPPEQPSTSKRRLEQENSSEAATLPDFTSTYVEYALPELRPELISFVKCEECGAQIPDDVKALQTHRDHHFAQQLNRQLRSEQREEAQRSRLNATTTTVTSPPTKAVPAKKAKKASAATATTPKPVNSITKFLAPKQPLESPPSCSNAPMELCAECKTYIKCVDMPEHLDFHMAKKLQRELNQLEVRTIITSTNKKSTPPPANKKLNSTLNATAANHSITKFFTQSN